MGSRADSLARPLRTRWHHFAPGERLVIRVLSWFGIILILGSAGHTIWVGRFYVERGLPDVNRILLDIWVAQAQLIGGSAYVAAARAARAGGDWRTPARLGAAIVLGWAFAFLPVLFVRVPLLFRMHALIYSLITLWILAATTVRDRR